ncbi:putative transport-related membrane protein [Pseudomonas putida S11]|nr:putative transport-related membrane protein [Pseudomonas putida S11]
MRRIAWRLLPFLIVCYLIAIIDRGNIGMASLQMNEDLQLTAKVFGFASSLFFFAYFLVEVPSNLAMQRYGARIWIARIMITWGLISAGTAFVQGAHSLYVMRFLLGAAEAGFFPGVLLYLTYWLPSAYRARMVALFMVAIPAANFIGSPLSGLLLNLDGWMGMRGWHWLFILEGIPAVLLGIACLFVLTDRPEQAKWLSDEQRGWLTKRLADEASKKDRHRPYFAVEAAAPQRHLGAGTDLLGRFCRWQHHERVGPAVAENLWPQRHGNRPGERHPLRHRLGADDHLGPQFRPYRRASLAHRNDHAADCSRPADDLVHLVPAGNGSDADHGPGGRLLDERAVLGAGVGLAVFLDCCCGAGSRGRHGQPDWRRHHGQCLWRHSRCHRQLLLGADAVGRAVHRGRARGTGDWPQAPARAS